MIVGTLEPKKNEKTGKDFYDLKMKIPFVGEQNFYVVKNDKPTGENSPTLKMFMGGNVAGAIWKKTSKAGVDYMSGSVFCLGMPNHRLPFAIFKSDDPAKKDEAGKPIYLVTISEGERKDGSAEDEAPKEDIF